MAPLAAAPEVLPPPPPSPPAITGHVKQGQTTLEIFRQAGIKAADVIRLHRALRSVYDIHRLRIGQPYRIQVSADGLLQHFRYDIDAQHCLEVERQAQTFVGRLEPIPYAYRERIVSGIIYSSVYEALTTQGESPRLVRDLAALFAWRVDVSTDMHQGNTFRLLIEERFRAGNAPTYHRILAAELHNRGRVVQAVYYPTENHGAYFQSDGHAMGRMFLRSPLHYTRISSRFSQRRLHPILHRYRPHLGVDYAAPVGTPVRSIGDGMVQWAGRKGGNGKMVTIRHKATYTSYYRHLSRFARGVRAGAPVQHRFLFRSDPVSYFLRTRTPYKT